MIELVVICAALAVLAGTVVWHVVETLWSRRLVARRRVVVQLVTDQTIAGVMWTRRGRTLVLKGAQVLAEGASSPVPMDGSVILDRDQVSWVQVVD